MTEIVQSPIRKVSFSSDISDLLPPTNDIDERIAKIKEAIQKSEVKRQIRKKHFRVRLKQCLKRIDTLEEKQVDRLCQEGVTISLEKVRVKAKREVQEEKEFIIQRSQEAYELRLRELKEENARNNPDTNDWPQNVNEEVPKNAEDKNNPQNFSSEKFVFSVKEELAKLNLTANTEKGSNKVSRNRKDPKSKEPIVLPVAKNEKPVRMGRRGSLQPDISDIPKGLERRGSLTLLKPISPHKNPGSGRRKSITTEIPNKYLQRRPSSQRELPDWSPKAQAPETQKKRKDADKKR
jgi:hypothetical protein